MILDLDLIEFEEYLANKKQLQPNSVYQYKAVLQKFLMSNPDIYNIEDYNKFIIEECIKKRKAHSYSVIKAYIQFKISDQTLRNKLITELIVPKARLDIVRERKYLDEDQIFEVINGLDKLKHKIISIILHLTGVRVGDIMKIKEGNIFFETEDEKPVIRIALTGKRGKRNVPYIYDEVAQQLIINYITQNPTDTGYYFLELSKYRKARYNYLENFDKLYSMNYLWYWSDLKQALYNNNLRKEDWASHDFRRCFARRAWRKFDKDIQVLQSLLNHQSVDTTLRYLEHSGLKNKDYYKEMQTQ